MKEYPRGSEWRRWDLHVHTPGTNKNDQYEGTTIEDRWNNFYKSISDYIGDGSDQSKSIVSIGVTDYLSIDNYKRIIAEKRLPESIKFVLPNVELRMTPMSRNEGINIHFLFDPAIVNELEDRFFSKLSFDYNGRRYSATRTQLVSLGKALDSALDEKAAYSKGVGQFIPSLDSLRNLFSTDPKLRENTIIIVSNGSNDGVTGAANLFSFVEGNSSDFDATRQSIYQFVDAIFSGNPSDTLYFLGEKSDSSDDIIKKCGTLKPCFHGCDAHTNGKLFEPDNQRYCWIKSDPSFNGLKQVLYEPKDRVRISPLMPEEKADYHVIDHMVIDDPDFSPEPILFNDKLSCIIGGKSTGKSILLHNLALTIDKKQVEEKIEMAKTKTRVLTKVKVFWKDGEVNETGTENYSHSAMSDDIQKDFLDAVSNIKNKADELWKENKLTILKKCQDNREKVVAEVEKRKTVADSLKDKVESNEAIAELSKRIQEEEQKLLVFSGYEKRIYEKSLELNEVISDLVQAFKRYNDIQKRYATIVNDEGNNINQDGELTFSVLIPFRTEAFCQRIKQLFDNRTLKSKKDIIDVENFDIDQFDEKALEKLVKACLNQTIPFSKSFSCETALRNILDNWYNVTYNVKMGDDLIDEMSPGKKALVLLKLLISLAESKSPILIDQPEDDLDNKSISDDLITFIKKKKIERQIIVVTHNANVVVAGDAEQVIVANQRGNTTPNHQYRFEYRSGAIEDNLPVYDNTGIIISGVLNSQGIQQHICDILEGGEKAFAKRKNKYNIKN